MTSLEDIRGMLKIYMEENKIKKLKYFTFFRDFEEEKQKLLEEHGFKLWKTFYDRKVMIKVGGK